MTDRHEDMRKVAEGTAAAVFRLSAEEARGRRPAAAESGPHANEPS
jgi:hypothetical protein